MGTSASDPFATPSAPIDPVPGSNEPRRAATWPVVKSSLRLWWRHALLYLGCLALVLAPSTLFIERPALDAMSLWAWPKPGPLELTIGMVGWALSSVVLWMQCRISRADLAAFATSAPPPTARALFQLAAVEAAPLFATLFLPMGPSTLVVIGFSWVFAAAWPLAALEQASPSGIFTRALAMFRRRPGLFLGSHLILSLFSLLAFAVLVIASGIIAAIVEFRAGELPAMVQSLLVLACMATSLSVFLPLGLVLTDLSVHDRT